MPQIAVSIIIPVYNVEPYVEECLKSVMCQTCAEPMECIIVDDCGTDNSMAIVEQLVADYKGPIRFEILRHDHNRGLSAARNTGIEHASGEYLMFIDSDDSVHPDFCKAAYECAIQHHADLVMFSHLDIFDDKEIEYRYSKDGSKTQHEMIDFVFKPYGTVIWDKIYLRQLFDEVSFPEGFVHEDVGTTYKLIMKATNTYYLDRILLYYRRRPGSITAQANKYLKQRAIMNLQRYRDLKAWGYRSERLENWMRFLALQYFKNNKRDKSDEVYVQLSKIFCDTNNIPKNYSSRERLWIYIFKYCPWLLELYYTMRGLKK